MEWMDGQTSGFQAMLSFGKCGGIAQEHLIAIGIVESRHRE